MNYRQNETDVSESKMNMNDDLHQEGNLNRHSLPQLLASFSREQRTGIATFTRGDVSKNIYFDNGSIVFASSSVTADRLGDFLLRKGVLSEEQYVKSAKLHEETGRRKGMILVEMGYLGPDRLISAINEHLKEIILSLFEWEAGHYKFRNSPPCDEVIILNAPLSDLINEGDLMIKKKEASRFNKEINELVENMGSLTHYELIGVGMDVSSEELKKAYLQKVKKYHPDKHDFMHDDRLKERLSNILSALNNAYNTLKDEKSRAEYDDSILKFNTSRSIKFNLRRSIKVPDPNSRLAESYYQNGINNFLEGDFLSASESFRLAAKMQPRKAVYWAHLALALSKLPKKAKEAEQVMLKAIGLQPNNSHYHMILGYLYLDSGLKLRAIREFENALKFDPDNKKAWIELDKIKMRAFNNK